MLRPSSLADFQAFSATDLSYGSGATTTGPIFVGENSSKVAGNLSHAGTAKANLYAEGTVTVTGTLAGGAKKYDKNTTPTALCELNNCTAVPFSSFANYFTTALGAANAAGLYLGATDPTPNGGLICAGTPCLPAGGNSALSGQSPAYTVDAWKHRLPVERHRPRLLLQEKYVSGGTTYADYDGTTAPVCGNQKTLNVPTNGVIYSAVERAVSGVVKGKVTVATAGNVIWAGQTTYNQNGVDVLGVMATNTIYVAQWAPCMSNNLTIYGAEFALNVTSSRQDPNFCSPTGTPELLRLDGDLRHHETTVAARQNLRALSSSRACSTLVTTTTTTTCSSCSRRSGRRSGRRSRSSCSVSSVQASSRKAMGWAPCQA